MGATSPRNSIPGCDLGEITTWNAISRLKVDLYGFLTAFLLDFALNARLAY
jgi:hypothetical protein